MLDEEEAADEIAALAKRASERAEYPGEAQIRALGALTFLYLRSEKHQNATLAELRRIIQPPVDLGFYRVFEVDSVPRSAALWAFLNPKAERKLLTERRLAPSDWLSGNQMWVIEIVAPYGGTMGGAAMNWLRRALPPEITRVRYLRTTAENAIRHVVEVNRGTGAIWGARRIDPETLISNSQ